MKINWKGKSDKIMAIAATITAAAALMVAVVETRGQQEFQKLSVEPYIELGNVGGDQIGHYAFLIVNNGLGPAIIKSTHFTVDGTAVSGWDDAVRIATETQEIYDSTYSSIYSNRRIKAAETVEAFKVTPYSELAEDLHNLVNSGRVDYQVCYCSVYDDCWKTSLQGLAFHENVRRCELTE